MEPPYDSSRDPETETLVDPIERKAYLYKMMAVLWFFPSLGAIVILALNWFSGSSEATDTQGTLSVRIEDLAAVGLLVTHGYLAIQRHRFHRLNQKRQRARLPRE